MALLNISRCLASLAFGEPAIFLSVLLTQSYKTRHISITLPFFPLPHLSFFSWSQITYPMARNSIKAAASCITLESFHLKSVETIQTISTDCFKTRNSMVFFPSTHTSKQTNLFWLSTTFSHLGDSLKDSELLRVGQRSIKGHHCHLRAAIREVLGNVSTGFGHGFNLLLTSQKHEDVLRRGCFLEPEGKAREKLQ